MDKVVDSELLQFKDGVGQIGAENFRIRLTRWVSEGTTVGYLKDSSTYGISSFLKASSV